jgi:Holliday junction resolvase RusA-like endonuclease
MTYRLVFEIAGLPKSPNRLLGAHWTARSSHAKKWKRAVQLAVALNGGLPLAPLVKARVHCVRLSSGTMDRDGLCGSFKSVMDALVDCGVLVDDSPDHVDVTYAQEKCAPKKGKISVTVEEVTA